MSEYESGCGYEIYTTEISDLFTGAKFITLSNVLYWRMGIILFGLQLTEIHINSQNEEIIDRRVLLNPGEFVIPSRDKFYVEGKYPYMYYILCILVLLFFFLFLFLTSMLIANCSKGLVIAENQTEADLSTNDDEHHSDSKTKYLRDIAATLKLIAKRDQRAKQLKENKIKQQLNEINTRKQSVSKSKRNSSFAYVNIEDMHLRRFILTLTLTLTITLILILT